MHQPKQQNSTINYLCFTNATVFKKTQDNGLQHMLSAKLLKTGKVFGCMISAQENVS